MKNKELEKMIDQLNQLSRCTSETIQSIHKFVSTIMEIDDREPKWEYDLPAYQEAIFVLNQLMYVNQRYLEIIDDEYGLVAKLIKRPKKSHNESSIIESTEKALEVLDLLNDIEWDRPLYCEKCGGMVVYGSRYCPRCGHPVHTVSIIADED